MKLKSNMLIVATAMAVGGLLSGSALASPVTEFYFSQDPGWLNPNTDGNGATFTNPLAFQPTDPTGFTLSMQNPTGGDAPANTFGTMRWTDTSSNSSAIHVNGYNDSTSFSNSMPAYGDTNGDGKWNAGEYWGISTVRQDNNVIYGNFPNPLWVADISANLRIFADGGHTINAFSDLGSKTTISFWETVNYAWGGSGNCNPGSPNPLGSVCDDVYTINLLELAPEAFLYNGSWYTLNFTLFPGNDVLVCSSASDPGCDASSAPAPGQIAVYTREGTNSTIHVAMAWDVPEPSMLSLVGLALVGLGLACRRRSV
jgi:hypothetical protein